MSGTKSGCLGVLVRLGRCPLPLAMLRQILLKGLNAACSPCLPTISLSTTQIPHLTHSPIIVARINIIYGQRLGCETAHPFIIFVLSGRAGRQRRLRTSTRRVRSALRIPTSTKTTIPRGRRDSLYRIGQKPRPPQFPESWKRQ